MKLTEHFSLHEFLISDTAARRGIDMTPPPRVIENLSALCSHVLEPTRYALGACIVTSGYRPRALNKAIGGSRTSQHCEGEATDFRVAGRSNFEVCQWMQAHLNYDQLIYEFGESGWVHVSYRPDFRNEELSAKRVRRFGRQTTIYMPGIIA